MPRVGLLTKALRSCRRDRSCFQFWRLFASEKWRATNHYVLLECCYQFDAFSLQFLEQNGELRTWKQQSFFWLWLQPSRFQAVVQYDLTTPFSRPITKNRSISYGAKVLDITTQTLTALRMVKSQEPLNFDGQPNTFESAAKDIGERAIGNVFAAVLFEGVPALFRGISDKLRR